MTPKVQLGRIGQIAMPVKDLGRAVAFYRDKLGMKFLFEAPPALAFFDCGGVRLMLDVPEDRQFLRHGSVLYFTVPDVKAAYEALHGSGVEFVDAPHVIHRTPQYELWMCFFHDTEENMLALMAEVPTDR